MSLSLAEARLLLARARRDVEQGITPRFCRQSTSDRTPFGSPGRVGLRCAKKRLAGVRREAFRYGRSGSLASSLAFIDSVALVRGVECLCFFVTTR
jgi:hypothetical protein